MPGEAGHSLLNFKTTNMKTIIIYIFKKILNNYLQDLKPIITDTYRKIAEKDLILDARILHVKKGHLKYDMCIIESPEGTRKINLQRNQYAFKAGL